MSHPYNGFLLPWVLALTWRVSFSSHYVYLRASGPWSSLFSFFFVLLGPLDGVAVPTSSTGWVQSSTTSSLLISCLPLPCSSSSRTSVVVLMSSYGCRSRGWHSTVTFVSPSISSPQSIESSMPGLPSMHGAFASFRTSLLPTAPCSGSSLCSDATPVECVLSSCIASLFSAWCSSP